MLCPICSHDQLHKQPTFGTEDCYIECPQCHSVMLVLGDPYEDPNNEIRRCLTPIVKDETVVAIVDFRGRVGPYRLARIPAKERVAWSVFVSKSGDVYAYKSPAKRWIKLKPGIYPENGSRPRYNLARDSGDPYYQPYDYWLLGFAKWFPPGTRAQVIIRHLDDNVANRDPTNYAHGTRKANARDFHKGKALGTLPLEKPVPVYISRGTKQRMIDYYGLKNGGAVGRKVEEIILERLEHDFGSSA